jgi:hypothetical protein
MKTLTAPLFGSAAILGLSLLFAGCSGSGGSSGAGAMYIESCSLGCGSAGDGFEINCAINSIPQNAEVSIVFSEPVDLSSVNSTTFRLVNMVDGTVPSGVFTVDATNNRRLVFRPSLTFTGPGNPVFGFDVGETYELRILGEDQDPDSQGGYIRSLGGKNNTTRMACTVVTNGELIDPVPGPPTMDGYVTDVLAPGTNAVTFDADHLPVGGQPLNGSSNLGTNSRVVLIFDDVMNIATIANQQGDPPAIPPGISNTITAYVDFDGNLNTTQDQIVQAGTWTVDVDSTELLRTVAIFTPGGGQFPTGGSDPLNPRKIVVVVSNQLLDLVGNHLENPGSPAFSTVLQIFEEETLAEDFKTDDNEDTSSSGGTWDVAANVGATGSGMLSPGNGGGSGRLGVLKLAPGEQLTLDTDSQEFPLASQEYSIMSNLDPVTDYDPTDLLTWPTVTIDQFGQAFEFTEISTGSGAQLILTGSRAGRIFARGELVHNGVLDLTGGTPAVHVSNSGGDMANNGGMGQETKDGGIGASAGPAGGAGGQGADRQDMTDAALPVMTNIGGILNPGAVNTGSPGVGIGGLPDGTGGKGGEHWPSILPTVNSGVGSNPAFGDGELTWIPADADTCRIAMVAGPGSGGAHALEGGNGIPRSLDQNGIPYTTTFPALIANTPNETPGGDNSSLDLDPPGSSGPANQRNLEFWRKHLRGGSGGGGGGLSLYGSKLNGALGPDCSGAGGLFPFFDHSAAGGGGGGGAVMLVAGRKLTINGELWCAGGDGGSSTQPGADIALCTQSGAIAGSPPDCEKYAAPGGAGAGGSIRLQSKEFELAGVPDRILVDGGLGGQGVGGSAGGDGSPGLVRIEYTGFVDQASDAAQFGPFLSPYLPGDPNFNDPFTSAAILSIGEWEDQTFRPESFSGSQSCWLETPDTQGSFLGIDFIDDTNVNPEDLDNLGWNMDVVYDPLGGGGPIILPYRGIPPDDSALPPEDQDQYDHTKFPLVQLGGVDFQTFLGTTLNHLEPTLSTGSLFVVRFQGVRASTENLDLCSLSMSDPGVVAGSKTPWVDHPFKLNLFSPQPNLVRFAVVFDEQLASFDPIVLQRILGVTNMRVRVQPN